MSSARRVVSTTASTWSASSVPVPADVAARIDDDLDRIGDSYEWYGLASAWRARAMLGRLVGEVWQLEKPRSLGEGETVDWWTVTRREPGTLVLRSSDWFPGEGWLGYRVDEHELVQVGALRPKGVPGFVYWKVLQAVHRQVFAALARHRLERVGGALLGRAESRGGAVGACDRRTTSLHAGVNRSPSCRPS